MLSADRCAIRDYPKFDGAEANRTCAKDWELQYEGNQRCKDLIRESKENANANLATETPRACDSK